MEKERAYQGELRKGDVPLEGEKNSSWKGEEKDSYQRRESSYGVEIASPFVFEMGIKHTEILVFYESKNTYYIYTPLFKISFLIYEIKF